MSSRLHAMGKWFPPKEFYVPELCLRCGLCCGSSDGHPCEHLHCAEDGFCSCDIYEHRLGVHRTVDGHPFVCVEIREVIEANGGYAGCAYVEKIRRLREGMGQDASDLGRLAQPDV